ncbi:hypothetical protein [Romboutsia timonensis]|uniref:hypothetical protein n=1 Tax=Romboutsia timonensis TaxID=1776391 RepID=UPI00399C1E86
MAMKKKFLGLAMAAMVAMPATSVYAFNANGETLTGNDTETMTQDVTVTGEVKSSQGTVAQGRLEVVLPTSLAFSVDQEGNFTNVNYSVTNNSPCEITVGVQQFSETNTKTDEGIVLQPSSKTSTEMAQLSRNNVQMALVGDVDASSGSKRYVDLGDEATKKLQAAKPILNVPSNQTKAIQLLGAAGKSKNQDSTIEQNGTTETFTVVFAVKKKA